MIPGHRTIENTPQIFRDPAQETFDGIFPAQCTEILQYSTVLYSCSTVQYYTAAVLNSTIKQPYSTVLNSCCTLEYYAAAVQYSTA